MKLVIAVVRGGPSGEHAVSLETGRMVLGALDREKYEPLDVIVDKDGVWHRDDTALPPEEALRGVDLVFNALHGVFGGDGTVQRIYEALGIWHTGSKTIASGRAFNKAYTKKVAEENGIRVPRYVVVPREADVEREAEHILRTFAFPIMVKPMQGSSSLAATFADNIGALIRGIRTATESGSAALVEEFIHGKEATTGVVEGLGDEHFRALPSFEIIVSPKYAFYDFEAKYAEGAAREESPGTLTTEEQCELACAARTMHQALNLGHYSRSDFKTNESGVHYLETNSEPALGENDLLPRALPAAGHSFPHFIDHIVSLLREEMASSVTHVQRPRYTKYYTRTLSVIESELWQQGERIELPALNERGYFFHPLFASTPGKGTSVYYNMADSHQDPRAMAYYFNDNRQEFLEILRTSREYFSLLETVLNSQASLPVLFHCLARAWPGIALANTFASECRELVDDLVRDASFRLFAENESKVYAAEAMMREWLRSNLPEKLRPYASVVKYDEVVTMHFPEQWELEARMKGFVFYRGRLFAASLRDIARRYGLILSGSTQQFTGHLRGAIACRGRKRGLARVLFDSSQAESVREGDILITSMTTPDLGSALQHAAAFVTDEGSLSCDASLVARAMGKPFIIGTGCATEFVKDGDMVEVDADEGIVRVIQPGAVVA
jgi:D-alanine-D-alanine ligase